VPIRKFKWKRSLKHRVAVVKGPHSGSGQRTVHEGQDQKREGLRTADAVEFRELSGIATWLAAEEERAQEHHENPHTVRVLGGWPAG